MTDHEMLAEARAAVREVVYDWSVERSHQPLRSLVDEMNAAIPVECKNSLAMQAMREGILDCDMDKEFEREALDILEGRKP